MIDLPKEDENLTPVEKEAIKTVGILNQNIITTTMDVTERLQSIFLGGTEESKNIAKQASLVLIARDRSKERQDEKSYEKYNTQLNSIKAEYYPNFTDQQLAAYLNLFFNFYTRIEQKALRNSETIADAKGFINRFYGVDKTGVETIKPLIDGDLPTVKPTQSIRDQMRRHHRAGTTVDPDTFRVLLPNSFILLRIRRPDKLRLARLIDDIHNKLRVFGKNFAVTSVHLERAGIIKEIMEMVYSHVEYHSVKGITDNYELGKYILINDIDVICAELLKAGSTKGINYHLTCMADKCGFSEVITVQPEDFTIVNSLELTPEQAKTYSLLINSAKKYTVKEIKALQNKYTFNGKEVDLTINAYRTAELGNDPESLKRPTSCIKLEVPTMETYFNCFDKMASTFNAKLKDYMVDYPKPEDYSRKRAEFMGSVRMGEYIHWVAEYRVFGDPKLEESEDVVYVRDNDDPNFEFEEGIIEIMTEDEQFYSDTFTRIIEEIPKATHVFTGLVNSEACPSCKQKKEKGLSISVDHGFTPIDMVMNFFDRTQVQLERLAMYQMLQEEIVS